MLEKKVFAEPFAHRRCLVPADGFYEWKHAGKHPVPMHITLKSRDVFAFAGLWEMWHDVCSFTVITTRANSALASTHERMPAFLNGDERHAWLHEKDPARLLSLLEPWETRELDIFQVSGHVNSAAVDDPRCIAPATEVQLSLL